MDGLSHLSAGLLSFSQSVGLSHIIHVILWVIPWPEWSLGIVGPHFQSSAPQFLVWLLGTSLKVLAVSPNLNIWRTSLFCSYSLLKEVSHRNLHSIVRPPQSSSPSGDKGRLLHKAGFSSSQVLLEPEGTWIWDYRILDSWVVVRTDKVKTWVEASLSSRLSFPHSPMYMLAFYP